MGTIFQRSERGGAGGKWYAEFTDHRGNRIRKSTGTRDRRTAEKILHQWEIDEAKRASGLIDVHAEQLKTHRDRPLQEHFDAFLASIKAKNRSAKHHDNTKGIWDRISAELGWATLDDIDSDSFEQLILKLQASGKSQRTIAKHAQVAKAFVKWAIRTGKLTRDSLATVVVTSSASDRKLRRRYLDPKEWPWLIRSIEGTRYGVPADERCILYEVAIQTGLRLNELRSLIAANCRFDSIPPCVIVGAESTKNRLGAQQVITESLAERWKKHLAAKKRTGKQSALIVCTEFKSAKMVREDVQAARAAWIKDAKSKKEQRLRSSSDFLLVANHAGEVIDFHSLRHTCGAWLAIQNVHPKTIQAVMRHSTIRLTLDTYGHLMPGAEANAIAKIAQMFDGQLNGQ